MEIIVHKGRSPGRAESRLTVLVYRYMIEWSTFLTLLLP